MECKEVQNLVERYLDSELPLSDMRSMENHLTQCHDCSRILEDLMTISTAIKKNGAFDASPALKRKVRKQLKELNYEDENTNRALPWLGFCGGVLAFVSVMIWTLSSFIMDPVSTLSLNDEIISAHVRSLMVDHVTDIESSDQHTVRPWFNGKLDFSPPVRDLSGQGFILLGGRLDYLQYRQVSALVYRCRAHVINVFVWPSFQDTNAGIETETRQSYNIINWSENDLKYWVISDLNMKELQMFADLIRSGKQNHKF